MKLLLVEDEERLARLVARGLTEEGHQVDTCVSGTDALEQGLALDYDAAVLDWGLPDLDGLAVLKQWRARGVRFPVLMLTARGTVPERVHGLRAGADDYLTKPFDFDELLARLDALHRRAHDTGPRQVGDVLLDERRRALVREGRETGLTAREFALARVLFERAGDVCTRTELLASVWGPNFDGEPNVVDVYAGYLRRKLGELEASTAIRTVRGVGFRLEPA
jgi:DNA-binding response OmpR family regulator